MIILCPQPTNGIAYCTLSEPCCIARLDASVMVGICFSSHMMYLLSKEGKTVCQAIHEFLVKSIFLKQF